MKYLLAILVLVGCGKAQDASNPFDPWPWAQPTGSMATLVTPPADYTLTLSYNTVVAGVSTPCLVTKTIPGPDAAEIYQRYCDQGPCTFTRTAGHPYPEFVFTMTSQATNGSEPVDAGVGVCSWNLPEAL